MKTATSYRNATILFALVWFVLTSGAGFAAAPQHHTPPQGEVKADMNSPRMQQAVKQAMAERLGLTASPDATYEGWTPKYTRYVGCLDSPAESTFSTPEAAFTGNVYIGPIQPYTQVKVCSGFYPGGNVLATSYVAIVGQGSSGSATISCATTSSNGIELRGSNDLIQNLSVDGCSVGVYISDSADQEVQHDEVMHSYFNYNDVAIGSYYCHHCEVENNEFQGNRFDDIYSYYDVSDVYSGNEIFGSPSDYAIYDEDSVNTSIQNNSIEAAKYGIYTYHSEFSQIEHNTIDGNNYTGLYMDTNTSGAKVGYNTLNGNASYGIYVANGAGANATTVQTPNQFLYNKAYHNGPVGVGYDYYDATFPYPNYNPHANDGTANYWHGNKGDTAYPPSILTS